MTTGMRIRTVVAALTSFVCTGAYAQNQADAQAHLDRARELAQSFVLPQRLLCGEPGGTVLSQAADVAENAEPTRVFDNLYYIGQKGVGAWAVTTSEGIILIDAIYTGTLETTLLPGFKKLGLDPSTVKYVMVTHGHGDHSGGAKYFQDKGDARIILSTADWDLLERPTAPGRGGGAGGSGRGGVVGGSGRSGVAVRPARVPDDKPRRDLVGTDGQKLTLGDTTITLVLTPGHTPGTISVIIPVKENGKSHVAGLWGGTMPPATLDAKNQYVESVKHFLQYRPPDPGEIRMTRV